MSDTVDTLWKRRSRFREQPLRFVILAVALMVVTYALLYFPYPPQSFPIRLFEWYLRFIARASVGAIRIVDQTAIAVGDTIQGQFSMRIVLDCAGLDAHALLSSAVLAFPAGWGQRAAGIVAGALVIATANVCRIVALYAIGVRWPAYFHVAHEEVFQFGMVLLAFLAFGGWAVWVRGTFGGGREPSTDK